MGMLYHRHITGKGEAKKPRPDPEVTEKVEVTQPKKRNTKKSKGE